MNTLSKSGYSTDPAVLKSSQNSKLQQIGDTLQLHKDHDEARANRDNAIKRGSKKIVPQDVVCNVWSSLGNIRR
jgi:hypothetical protein